MGCAGVAGHAPANAATADATTAARQISAEYTEGAQSTQQKMVSHKGHKDAQGKFARLRRAI